MAVAATHLKGSLRQGMAIGVAMGIAAVLGVLSMSAGCVSSTQPLPKHAAPPASTVASTDPSYDWHGLVLTPFGTLLKESPVPLHEVLLFHDEAQPATEAQSRDCYAIDGMPPRFVGLQPEQYLLCFDHDRLNRIEASVRLGAEQAAQVFAQACAVWLKTGAPPGSVGTMCEGRDGGVAFSGRLVPVPGEASVSLTMTLTDVAPREP